MFSRFLQLRDLLVVIGREEIRDKFIISAFIAWQMGAGAGMKFGEYLEGIGLSEKQPVAETPEDKELTAKDAIKKAEEILAMASKKVES